MKKRLLGLVTGPIMLLAACSDDSSGGGSKCDETRRPVVMAHGFLASGDTYANHFMRFTANGYCASHLYAYDWNTFDTVGDPDERLDQFINKVLAESGAAQVDLAGHSAGGGLGYSYLSDEGRAAKVAHYAHLASFPSTGPAGPAEAPVPTLNVWSPDDTVVSESGDIPGATNASLAGQDHMQVATTEESFEAIYRYFNDGEEPETTGIIAEEPIVLSGRAVTLGENTLMPGAEIQIFEVNPDTGERLDPAPTATLTADADGYWGPFDAQPETYYEFRVSASGIRPIHYYREPFVRSDPLVYLRTIPSPDSLIGALMNSVPFGDDHALAISFTANQAVYEGRDTLSVNGISLNTPVISAKEATTIAIFYFDVDEDPGTNGEPATLLGPLPFLRAVDLNIPTEVRAPVKFKFNGRTLNVPNWPSGSEGAAVAVFN